MHLVAQFGQLPGINIFAKQSSHKSFTAPLGSVREQCLLLLVLAFYRHDYVVKQGSGFLTYMLEHSLVVSVGTPDLGSDKLHEATVPCQIQAHHYPQPDPDTSSAPHLLR